MSVGWESLPLIPLRCILDHLSLKDALNTMSVCRHWRNALLVYEGHKEVVKLRGKQTERNLFLARLFRKHVRKLHIYLDGGGENMDKLFDLVLPEFFDTLNLQEILFIGPSFMQQTFTLHPTKLKRVLTESLIFKHSHCLTKLAMLGCEMDVANDNDRYMNERIEYFSTPLVFNAARSVADNVLSGANAGLMVFSSLQHITVDYEQINTQALETLSNLPVFSLLSVNICNKRQLRLKPFEWHRLAPAFPNGLNVAVNIIALPLRRFTDVMENVLVEGLPLVSLKVFFCKNLYPPLLSHVVRFHKNTLRCVVWADSPLAAAHPYHRVVSNNHEELDGCNINPFILLCWQCVNLKKLVIHGYWIWQYDVLGFVRLRKSLQQLEVSSIYNLQSQFAHDFMPDTTVRVMAGDVPVRVDRSYVQEVNSVAEFRWSPTSWGSLHPALGARATTRQRCDYITRELTNTDDVM